MPLHASLRCAVLVTLRVLGYLFADGAMAASNRLEIRSGRAEKPRTQGRLLLRASRRRSTWRCHFPLRSNPRYEKLDHDITVQIPSKKPRWRVWWKPAKVPASRATFCAAGRDAKLLAVRTGFGVRRARRCQGLECRVVSGAADRGRELSRVGRILASRTRGVPRNAHHGTITSKAYDTSQVEGDG